MIQARVPTSVLACPALHAPIVNVTHVRTPVHFLHRYW
jgi:hypothetical protein